MKTNLLLIYFLNTTHKQVPLSAHKIRLELNVVLNFKYANLTNGIESSNDFFLFFL